MNLPRENNLFLQLDAAKQHSTGGFQSTVVWPRAMAGETLPLPLRRILKVRRQTENFVVERLAAATNEDDLDARIEAILEDDVFHRLYDATISLVTPQMVRNTLRATSKAPSRLLEGAGRVNEAMARRAVRYEAACVSAWLQILGAIAKQSQQFSELAEELGDPATGPVDCEEVDNGPLGFVRDERLPPEVKMSMFGRWIAEVAVIGIGAAAERDYAGPWLIRALVERWTEGKRQYLRFLAGFPEVVVPSELIAPSEVLDLERIFAEHVASQKAFETRVREASASDADVYPLPGLIDD